MVVLTHRDTDDITCVCGNTPRTNGFYPCDRQGNEMEPTLESSWDGLYVCAVCQQLHRFEENL